jgi:hypothetical protein
MTPHQEEMLKEVHAALVGNEAMGHIGLIKRVSEVEKSIISYSPAIQSFVDRKNESKKLRSTIIASAVTVLGGLVTHITILLNHK